MINDREGPKVKANLKIKREKRKICCNGSIYTSLLSNNLADAINPSDLITITDAL